MVLKTNGDSLARELTAAQTRLSTHMASWEPMVSAYRGRAWEGIPSGKRDYDSHHYEYVASMLPTLAYAVPQFELTTSRGPKQQKIVSALESGLNRWARASDLESVLEELALDSLFGWGLAYIEEVPNDRMKIPESVRTKLRGSNRKRSEASGDVTDESAPYWPNLRRLDPKRCGWDVTAKNVADARFWYHLNTEDKDDLLRKARKAPNDWYPERIESLSVDTNPELLGYSDGSNMSLDREQVVYYVVWVPDAKIDGQEPKDDEHGVVFTLAVAGNDQKGYAGEHIRRPYYFYGPSEGPYILFGLHNAKDSSVPLGPLTADYDWARAVAEVDRSHVNRVKRHKRGVAYNLKDKKDIERIASAPDDYFIGITGLSSDGFIQYEHGGLSQGDPLAASLIRERLHERSGMDSVRRGNVTGEGTAREVVLASQASELRSGHLQRKFRKQVAEAGRRIGWYLGHDERIVFMADEQGRRAHAEQTGMEGPEAEEFARNGTMAFEGGDFSAEPDPEDPEAPEEGELSFDDLVFDIEPLSMERRDSRTRKMDSVEALNMLGNYAAMTTQGAPLDLGKVADYLADVYAMPELPSLVNTKMAAALGILNLERQKQALLQADAASSEPMNGSQPRGNVQSTRSEVSAPPGQGGSPGQRLQPLSNTGMTGEAR